MGAKQKADPMLDPVIDWRRGENCYIDAEGTYWHIAWGSEPVKLNEAILRADEDLPDAGTTPPLIPGGWFNYIPATHKTNNCDCQYCKPTAPKAEPFHNPFQEFFGDDKRLGASQYRDE